MADNTKVAIIGGGAAGLMAAISAAQYGADVTIFEKNKYCARKLRITGKGRCNVTNNCTPEEMLKAVNRNSKFLYSSIFTFTPSDAMDFFESLGVPLKTERGRRVFPISDKATDVSDALIEKARELGVRIINTKVEKIETENDTVTGIFTSNGIKKYDAVILATGGVSYTATGSTGDGHNMAKSMGIKVTELTPSLIPIITKEKTSDLMGLTLKNVTLSVMQNDKIIYSEMGEMLFTHFGVSGPLVLSASAHMHEKKISEYKLEIDLKPALNEETLDKRVCSDLQKYSNRDFVNSLNDLIPKSLIPSVIKESGIPERTRAGEITKEMRHNLCRILKHYSLTPVGFRPINEAIITCGGIDVSEINPGTMMSKKYKGLFFAGEIIDVDAYTGGYNLQIAWSTGKKAGESAAMYYAE